MELNDTLQGLISSVPTAIAAGAVVLLALTYGPRLWAAIRTKAADVVEDLDGDDELPIDKAFAALQTVREWGKGRSESYQRGLLLIEDNWLSHAEEPVEPA